MEPLRRRLQRDRAGGRIAGTDALEGPQVAREQLVVQAGEALAQLGRIAQRPHPQKLDGACMHDHADRGELSQVHVRHHSQHREVIRQRSGVAHRRADCGRGGIRRRRSRASTASARKGRGARSRVPR